ncbi:cytochrome b N-terminal domain-containing protein [Desulfogranum mediterraneum]|uniref:cytochrome b N-terminal domain-containing protein n=1 Tax=Desulfogranum mediterraneum TaxID=160661 RepID=UPI00040BB0EE|nr:cytochrome b N-terminal domain-containing protein [Desulfogranum mediterraneum]
MRVAARCKALFIANRWGGQTLISLYISIISGIILALHYSPATPFYHTATIELIAPYGSFWRALHYYSSQAFFLLLTGHIAAILWQQSEIPSRSAWIRLCSSFPVAVLLLFSGYVLRGDATGEAAGAIAENICLSIPVVGQWLNDLLFDLQESGLRKPYLHHLCGLMVLGAFTLWPHLKRYPARWSNHLLLVALTLLVSIFWTAPMEPERLGLLHIAGPWFFLGLQELLRYLPTFIAGVAIPLLPLLLIYLLPSPPGRRRGCVLALLAWLLAYGVFTLLSYLRI